MFLPSIALDRASSLPLHHQLGRQVAQAIRRAPSGTRLPSSRVLAQLLGVSRNTVLTAYDDLAAAGLIQGRRGRGMVVAGHAGRLRAFTPRQVLRDGHYPARTLLLADQDGLAICVAY
jgi:GntR family transcriptional regulator